MLIPSAPHCNVLVHQDTPGVDKTVTIGRYVREISVKARYMLGRQQAAVAGSSRRPSPADHPEHEPDTLQETIWDARETVSLSLEFLSSGYVVAPIVAMDNFS